MLTIVLSHQINTLSNINSIMVRIFYFNAQFFFWNYMSYPSLTPIFMMNYYKLNGTQFCIGT